ncbi:hypothetical protein F2Q70_00039944 [Brassica cretica]|uniref:Uncharacterized protein n=1 Tax=Brassica cretica TaxID=69181 RepID=A0A8S9K602_BRACR|nr:hypothetical protein F2Q70_00039944 [Brassica cretica]
MINSNQVSRSHLPEVEKPKAPQTNWSEHAKAFEDPSSRTKHLSSGFLYALESQKPRNSRDMAARSIAFPSVNAHTLAHPQIAKAWRALSSLSLNKTYLRPGITPPVDDGGTNGSYSARERSTVKVTCSTDGSFYSNNQQNQSQMGVPGTGRNFHSFPPPVPGDGKIFAEKFPRINDEAREPENSCTPLNGVEKPFKSSAFAAEQLESGEACLDEIIDDDILQVIRSHLPEVQKPKPPQTNWSEHAKALEVPSSRTKHLSSGFLYALESQKPRKSRDMAARAIAFPSVNAHTLAHPQIAKAWSALSSLSLNKTYLRPGITPPVDDGGTNGSYSARERSTVKVTCSTDGSFYSNNQQNQSQMGVPGTGRNFHSFPPPVPGDGKIFPEKFPRINDEAREPETSSAHLNGVEKPFRSSAFAAEQLGSGEACLDEIDDDILQNIDVDQIMMEHYQSTSTPPPSVSSLPSRTPPVDKSASRREEESCLPPELCSNCSHGIKLGLCPEASTHLEQMKNVLIAISNELLDDDTDLSPDRIQELRQERLSFEKY